MSGGISMLQIGSYVDGKYKVLNKIGQGGMSVVYLALNEKANNDKLNDRFYRIRQIQTMRSEFRIISYFAKWLESIEKQDGFPSC